MQRIATRFASMILLAGAITFALTACQSGNGNDAGQMDEGSRQATLEQTQPVEIRSQMTGSGDGPEEMTVRLIKNQKQLKQLDFQPAKDVNLQQNDLVLVALGEQNTGGYWVRIDGIQRVGRTLYVEATINKPGEGQATTQALTYPYTVAVIPNTQARGTPRLDYTTVSGQPGPEQGE